MRSLFVVIVSDVMCTGKLRKLQNLKFGNILSLKRCREKSTVIANINKFKNCDINRIVTQNVRS